MFQTTGKVAYVNPNYNEEDDLYIYGGMETDEDARWKFASDRIEFGKNVPNANGRFADFRFANIFTKSGQDIVVAKMLKCEFILILNFYIYIFYIVNWTQFILTKLHTTHKNKINVEILKRTYIYT